MSSHPKKSRAEREDGSLRKEAAEMRGEREGRDAEREKAEMVGKSRNLSWCGGAGESEAERGERNTIERDGTRRREWKKETYIEGEATIQREILTWSGSTTWLCSRPIM